MQVTNIEIDDSFMELRNHGTPQFPFEYYYDEIEKYEHGYVPMHWHREFELLLVLSGEIECLIGDENIRLGAGDGMFIGSNVFHQFYALEGGRTAIPNILFAPEFFAEENSRIYQKYMAPFLQGKLSYAVLKPSSMWQKNILDHLSYIHSLFERTEDTYELEIQEKVIAIWRQLYSHMDEIKTEAEKRDEAALARVKKMVMYIEVNYMEKQVLSDIARAANISKTEALRCFKKCMNISPVNYLLIYRLQEAGKMLKRTRKSISEIAVECGFDNISYFDRMFRRFCGQTPSEFRKNHRKYKQDMEEI